MPFLITNPQLFPSRVICSHDQAFSHERLKMNIIICVDVKLIYNQHVHTHTYSHRHMMGILSAFFYKNHSQGVGWSGAITETIFPKYCPYFATHSKTKWLGSSKTLWVDLVAMGTERNLLYMCVCVSLCLSLPPFILQLEYFCLCTHGLMVWQKDRISTDLKKKDF